jgi:hypothetical protein
MIINTQVIMNDESNYALVNSAEEKISMNFIVDSTNLPDIDKTITHKFYF